MSVCVCVCVSVCVWVCVSVCVCVCNFFRRHLARQYNQLNSSLSRKKPLRWDSNPHHTAYEADALPTELPRQLSWLG